MDLPISLQSTGGLAALAFIVGLFWWLHQRRPKSGTAAPKMPEMGYAYEWVSTPLAKANRDMRERFPEMETVLGSEPPSDVHLVRFGLFNMTEEIVTDLQVTQPIEIHFAEGTKIESARFGESLKTERRSDAEPVIDGARVILPSETMNPRSTLIYNLILRGGSEPQDVLGETEGYGRIRRVN